MATLTEISGTDPGRQIRLDRNRMILGRHPDCDIIIEVGAVSRHHAQILLIDGEYFVEDLKSRNGTFINERLVRSRQRLTDDDHLRVCDVSFSFSRSSADSLHPRSSFDESGVHTILVDDGPEEKSSTIMSRLDVSAQERAAVTTTSAEAKLKALLDITQSLGKALSLDEVLPKVLGCLFNVFVQADRGFIVLRQDDGSLIPRWTKLRDGESEDTVRISRTIVNQVMETRKAILSADAATDERFEMSQSIADFRLQSVMCAPLINSEKQVLGVLQLDTLNQAKRFQTADLEVLASAASQAAIAIDNAQLYDRVIKQRSVERELEVAQQVQQSFLPRQRPEIAGYKFCDYYRPANQIGGDFYDYVVLPDGRVAVVVADVVGHGVAAALLMAKLSSETRFCLATESQPARVASRLNKKLCDDNIDDRFVTFVLAMVHSEKHEVTMVNAGHPPPMLTRGGEEVTEVGKNQSGFPLGVVDKFEYEQIDLKLDPGEIFTMFTDGLSEAMDAEGQLYGLGRIRQQAGSGANSPESMTKQLVDDVHRFLGDVSPGDDMCMVCFGRS